MTSGRERLGVSEPPIYNAVRNNFEWADHAIRTLVTAGMIAWLAPDVIWDPACGDASILEASYKIRPFRSAILADVSHEQIAALKPSFPARVYQHNLIESFEKSTEYPRDEPKLDCIVLTEILEHLEDPAHVLRMARELSTALVASVPIGDPELGRNHEHLWSWDLEAFETELKEAGWDPFAKTTVQLRGVAGNSQIWVAR